NPSTVYVGGVLGIYKSVDSGSTWRLVSTSLGSSLITALVIDPRNSATLYAADYGGRGILRSGDGGGTWREFNTGLTNRSVEILAIDGTGTRLHAGTFHGGVFDYQIFSGAQDLSVGTDNKTRVLFTDLDNRAAVRSFDRSSGSAGNGPHGPYNGWYARAVADGSDGLTRVL